VKAVLVLLLLMLGGLSCGCFAHAECLTVSCHPGLAEQAYPHTPVEEDCLACHVAVTAAHPVAGEKNFRLVAEGAQLCYQCHDPFPGRSIHAPVKEGECLACHQVHGGENPYLLGVGNNLAPLCFGCHDDAAFRLDYRHGPAAAGACTSCHDPHAAESIKLQKKPVRDACLECHADFARQMSQAPIVHEPVREAPCTDCHDPHAGVARYVLKQKMPDLCFTCHEDNGERLAAVKVPHAPLNDARSCGSCHSTHFSQASGLLPDVERNVCLGCHGSNTLGNPPLADIRVQLQEKPVTLRVRGRRVAQEQKDKQYLHGPLQEGKCSGCHDPHGSDNFRILTGPYPADFYAPYKDGIYDFCLQCHERYLLRFKETTLYTEFRNGTSNLHVMHVGDKRKGRTCRICHEAHASNGSKLINLDGSRFGDWKVPINLKLTPAGGSCAPGCHQPLAYDRETPVIYRLPAAEE